MLGLAFAPRHGAGDTLPGCTDAAMYAAKRSRGVCYDTYYGSSADSADRLQLQQGCARRCSAVRLALHFQPVSSAADGSPAWGRGAAALAPSWLARSARRSLNPVAERFA